MKLRGDIKLELGDEVITLVPSFLNLMEIEDRLAPATIFSLIENMERRNFRARELVTILYCGTGYPDADTGVWTSKHEFAEFGEACLEAGGVAGLIAPAMELLTTLLVAMRGEPEDAPKKKASPKTAARKRTTGPSGATSSR